MANPKPEDGRPHIAGVNHLLAEELSKVLPKGAKFEAYHLSTPPTATEALYYPPAAKDTIENGEPRPMKPPRTYCEKHFLALSINAEKDKSGSHGQVLVFGLEIYIYTNSFSTTIFVAKADSTGYLSLLNLPKGTPSPIREVTSAFIAFLVVARRRPYKTLAVNLFARSQSQYLFPGSVKNGGKHILDDRGLVKWWCKVLNSLVEGSDIDVYTKARHDWYSIYGYLVVPGLDEHAARRFLPSTNSKEMIWRLEDPLRRLAPFAPHLGAYGESLPPRCLIPTYPDDPKARFVEELEEATSTRLKLTTGWKSPKNLAEFWEMMAFRQECSSGRLTGFIWVVFDSKQPARPKVPALPTPEPSFSHPHQPAAAATDTSPNPGAYPPLRYAPDEAPWQPFAPTPPKPQRKARAKKLLKGRIIPRRPQVKTHNRIKLPDRIETPYYFWPEAGRGQVILDESGYNRAVELLLNLEFAKLDVAITSTARWTNEVNIGAKWGLEVVGAREAPPPPPQGKKRPAEDEAATATAAAGPVNTLGSGLIRKKPRSNPSEDVSGSRQPAADSAVNVLGAGLVRKKAKPAETEA